MTTSAFGTNGQSWVRYDSTAFEAGVRIAGSKLGTYGAHLKAAASAQMWLLVFDAVALPNNGTVPKLAPLNIQPGFESSFDATGKGFANGIVLVLSTTDTTLTIDTGDSGFFFASEG